MDFQTAVRTCFQKYAMFEGRASRPEYWWFFLFLVVGNFVLGMVSDTLGLIFSLATLMPGLAVGARRLHDTGRSGWWQLIALTIIGVIPLIIWLAAPGVTSSSAYSSEPAA